MAKAKYSLFQAVQELLKCVNGRDIDITTIMPDVENENSIVISEDVRALRCNFNYAGNHTPDAIKIYPNWDRASQSTTVNLLHPDNIDILAIVSKVKYISESDFQNSTNESLLDEICQADWETKDSSWWNSMFTNLDNNIGELMIMPMMSGMIIGGYNGQGIVVYSASDGLYVLGLDYNALINYHLNGSHYNYYTFELLTTFVDGSDDEIPDGTYDDRAWFYGLRNEFGVEDANNDGSKGMLVLSLSQYNGTNNNFIASASPDYIIPDKYTQLFDKESNSSMPGGSIINPGQLAP